MGITFALLAALLASLNNYTIVKSIQERGSSRLHLALHLSVSIFVSFFLEYWQTSTLFFDKNSFIAGVFSGVFLALMLLYFARALEKGPSHLTVAYFNASAVLPACLLYWLFGPSFGHTYRWNHAAGSVLLLLGLAHASLPRKTVNLKKKWFILASLAFLYHSFYLSCLSWHALLMKQELLPSSWLLPFAIDVNKTDCFSTGVFCSASFFHIFVFFQGKEKKVKFSHCRYGILGGFFNALMLFCLLEASFFAGPRELAMIYPLFTIAIISFSALIGQFLFKEKVAWFANGIAFLGILVGTLDWDVLFSS